MPLPPLLLLLPLPVLGDAVARRLRFRCVDTGAEGQPCEHAGHT